MSRSWLPLLALLALLAFLVWGGCSSTTSGAKSGIAPPEEAPEWKKLADLVPPSPTGFDKVTDVTPRTRKDIFEQINGGSVSYLENGMKDALFATFPHRTNKAAALELELFRFDGSGGAKAQFRALTRDEGKPWKGGSIAVLHEYGVELVVDHVIVRATFNDGPAKLMALSAQVLARQIVKRISGK